MKKIASKIIYRAKSLTILVLGMAIFASESALAQGSAYEVPGISAWNTGKTYGFTFHPEANSGESVSRPLDGMNTRLTRTEKILLTSLTVPVAQVVGGQPSVMSRERNTTFTMFGARTLQPGWTVKTVDVIGDFTYVQQPRLGTADLSFRVRLAPGGSATLRKVVLNGPSGADWKDAFSAPVRRDYVINGTVAWNSARKYGFTFTPLKEGDRFVKGLPDGVYTLLMVKQTIDMGRCQVVPDAKIGIYIDPHPDCIVGQLVGGNMSVMTPLEFRSSSQSVSFEFFGAKKLSPGWIVKSVTTSNGTWTRQPAYGTDNLSFVLRVTSYANSSAIAIVKSITLEGPSNAASFEDAFRNAQNP
jgi:hypothetical protein